MPLPIWHASYIDIRFHFTFTSFLIIDRLSQVVLLPRSSFKLPFFAKYAIVGVLYIYFIAHGPLFWVGKARDNNMDNYFIVSVLSSHSRWDLFIQEGEYWHPLNLLHSLWQTHFPLWQSSISQSINCFNGNILYAVYVVIFTVSLCVIVLSSVYSIFLNPFIPFFRYVIISFQCWLIILQWVIQFGSTIEQWQECYSSRCRIQQDLEIFNFSFQALVPCVFILLPIVMICVQVVINFETYGKRDND